MNNPDQVRRKLHDLSTRRASEEKQLADARAKQAKKTEEAASYRRKAAATKSMSMQRSYLRSAESSEKAAHTEGRRVAEQSKRLANLAKQEASLTKDLMTAIKAQEQARERTHKAQAAAAFRVREQERLTERQYIGSLLATSEAKLTQQILEIRKPKAEPLRILYLTVASGGKRLLRMDKELRRVRNALKAAKLRDHVELLSRTAATTSDMLDALTEFQPHVVHFSGHGTAESLVFDIDIDTDNPGQHVPAGSFAKALGVVDEPPTLVVLNACDTVDHLEGLIKVVPFAIGMADEINDEAAIVFAARFYATVANGQSVRSAINTARVDLELQGWPDAELPLLQHREDVDPAEVRLVLPPI